MKKVNIRKLFSRIMAFVLTFVILIVIIPSKINTLAISVDQVKSQLDYYISSVYKPGSTPPSGSYRSGTSGCFGFIDLLLRNIMEHNLPSYRSNHYEFPSNSYLTQIGNTLTVESGSVTTQNLKNLFLQAQPGDVVQMDYTPYSGSSDSLHTMMVYSVSDNGVVFYHAGSSKVYFGATSGSQPLWGTSGAVLTWDKFLGFLKSSDDGISLWRSNSITSSSQSDIRGCLDVADGGNGTFTVSGWGFDYGYTNTTLQVQIYLNGPYNTSDECHLLDANIERTDINSAYPGAGNYHGFRGTFSTEKTGTVTLYIYLTNPGINYILLSVATVNIGNATYGGTLDINSTIDGNFEAYLAEAGTVDVYINDTLVVDDANDYVSFLNAGSKYLVTDIKANEGYEYIGSATSYSGYINGNIEIILPFVRTHTHSYGEWQVVTPATCTASGSSKRVCSCGDVKTRIDAATGHSWNSGEIITNAGCTSDGLKKYICSKCGAISTEVVSAVGHTPVIDNAIAATCTEDGITEGSHCAVCNAIIKAQQTVNALGHDDKIISVKKGCDFVVATYKCAHCGETHDGDKKESIVFDWSESKPQEIDDSLIEKKTQYSYRDKITKTSGDSSLSGWTLDYSTWEWSDYGAWSGWSDSPYYASDSRQIDTQTVVASYNYKTVWHYYCYSSNANLTGGTSYYPNGKYGYNKYSFDFEEELSPTGKTYTYNGYTIVQYKWWFSNTNYHHLYAVYPGEAPYQYTTQEIASTNYKTQYRYRDRNKIYTYYYYKWSDFSDWSDTEYIASENRQVRTRILYKFSIIPTGHTWNSGEIITNAGCTSDGLKKYICSKCGAISTEVVSAVGHTPGEWEIETPATCTSSGTKIRKCTVCKEIIERQTIPMTDHECEETVVPATPDEQGYTLHKCKNCPYSYKDTFVEYVDENATQIMVDTKKTCAGKTVLVNVTLENNPGIWGMDLVVNYDKTKLTLNSVTNGTVFSDSEWTKGNLSGEKYILSYEAGDFENITTNGVIATLEFAVNDAASEKDFYEISVSYRPGDIIDVGFNEPDVAIVSGGVQVIKFVYGDLNDDGLVNKKDSLLMKMYLADNTTVINQDAADVFADGAINKKDSLLLKQFLAGLDVVLGA